MAEHINNRDLCYEGEHTFNNVAHNFEVSKDTYQELRGKNMEKIKSYHDEVMKSLEESITEYKTNSRGGDGYILVNKINPTVKHLNTINLKIIDMLEETMKSMGEIELNMEDTQKDKSKFESKLNEINKEIEDVEKRIEGLNQNLKNKSKITSKLEDENKIFFIVNCIILGVVFIGCLYIIFRPNKNKQKRIEAEKSNYLFKNKDKKGPELTKNEKENRKKVLSKLLNQSNKNTEITGRKNEKKLKKEEKNNPNENNNNNNNNNEPIEKKEKKSIKDRFLNVFSKKIRIQ